MRRLLLLASAVVFVDTAFYAAITPLLPHYVDTLHISKSAAGVLSAAYPAGTFLGSIPGGYLAARAGVKPTTMIGAGSSMLRIAGERRHRSSTSKRFASNRTNRCRTGSRPIWLRPSSASTASTTR